MSSPVSSFHERFKPAAVDLRFEDPKPLKFSRSGDGNARIFLFINTLGDSDVSSTHLEKTNCI